MVLENKIKPCPFCKSVDVKIDYITCAHAYIHCIKCGADGPMSDNLKNEESSGIDAIMKWNKRG
jgi:Lar family restriction alleviation protein